MSKHTRWKPFIARVEVEILILAPNKVRAERFAREEAILEEVTQADWGSEWGGRPVEVRNATALPKGWTGVERPYLTPDLESDNEVNCLTARQAVQTDLHPKTPQGELI